MGNEVSFSEPYPGESDEETTDNGVEAVNYFNSFKAEDDVIKEYSINGVTIIGRNNLDDVNFARSKSENFAKYTLADDVIQRPVSRRSSGPHCRMSQDFLDDVVYAVLPLIGNNSSLYREREVTSSSGSERASNACNGTEVVEKLEQLFTVSKKEVYEAIERAQRKKIPELSVEVGVLEARNLRSRIPKGDTSNPFCIVRIVHKSSSSDCSQSLDSCTEQYKTAVIFESINPNWNAWFQIDGVSGDGDQIIFEVWHFCQDGPLDHFMDKIPFGLPKVLKKETKNLLGSAAVDLQNCHIKEFDSWLRLTKPKDEDLSLSVDNKSSGLKKRGEIHVKMRATRKIQLTQQTNENFQNMLTCVADQYNEALIPWKGRLSAAEEQLIDSFCDTYDVSPLRLSCTWWLVLSADNHNCDYEYILRLLEDVRRVTIYRRDRNDKDIEELENSLIFWMNLQVIKMKDLHSSFPPTALWSERQLTYCLRALKFLEEKLDPRLLKKSVHPYNICIAKALEDFVESWWNKQLISAQSKAEESEAAQQQQEAAQQQQQQEAASTKTAGQRNFDEGGSTENTLSDFRARYQSICRSFRDYTVHQNKGGMRNIKSYSSFKHVIRDRKQSYFDGRNGNRNSPCQNEKDIIRNLEVAVITVNGVYNFMSNAEGVYNSVFYKEFKISFFSQSYICLSNKVNTLLKPCLARLYSGYAGSSNLSPKGDPLALERGTPVYDMFSAIRNIEMLCTNHDLNSEIQLDSGFRCYWQWFSEGAKLWLKRTHLRTENKIKSDVEADDLKVSVEEDYKYTFSAVSAIEVHKMIVNGFRILHWPKEDIETNWPYEIGKVLCSLTVLYCQKIRDKLDDYLSVPGEEGHVAACYAINNISVVKEALSNLPNLLKDLTNISNQSPQNPEIHILLEKTNCEIDNIANSFLEWTVKTLSQDLSEIIENSCVSNDSSLATKVLSRIISFYKAHLLERNFRMFLAVIWAHMLQLLTSIAEFNKFRQKSTSFFQCLYCCLEKSLTLFHSEDDRLQLQMSEEYDQVKGLLSNLKLPTESIITKYYLERYEEQQNISSDVTSYGKIAVRGTITHNGILILDVILAENLEYTPKAICSGIIRHQETKQKRSLPSSYVTVRFITSSRFSGIQSYKTKVQKRSLDPVFNETFKVWVGCDEDKLKSVFIHLLIYNRGCLSDFLIGESLLPLTSIVRKPLKLTAKGNKDNLCTAQPLTEQQEAKNFFLRITKPRINEDNGYESLKLLETRRLWDKAAQKFLMEINKY